MLEESYLDRKFMYSVQGFFQNNHEMAEQMVAYSKELLMKHHTSDATLLDLYGGVGSFGIVNSDLFKDVLIVEGDKNCIDAAEKNITLNKCENVKAQFLDAKQLKKLEFPGRLFVVNDPPRSGMHPKALQQLRDLKPEVIIYVSCNVKQLAKELPKFAEYDIKSAALFDLFPQTPHSEAVIELVRKENAEESE
jgi:tRNA/tmRNA/rRNA uracil-C5-methylase (TrmA/RlmC/RlmD family)